MGGRSSSGRFGSVCCCCKATLPVDACRIISGLAGMSCASGAVRCGCGIWDGGPLRAPESDARGSVNVVEGNRLEGGACLCEAAPLSREPFGELSARGVWLVDRAFGCSVSTNLGCCSIRRTRFTRPSSISPSSTSCLRDSRFSSADPLTLVDDEYSCSTPARLGMMHSLGHSFWLEGGSRSTQGRRGFGLRLRRRRSWGSRSSIGGVCARLDLSCVSNVLGLSQTPRTLTRLKA